MRIDKFISNNTNLSRKEVNKLLKTKNVYVNGNFITQKNYKVNINNDIVMLNNKLIVNKKYFYIALNKPINYVCSTNDNDGDSILNLLDPKYQIKNLHIIGRLDKDTTGLIIITNDGHFTHRIKSPKSMIAKVYQVELLNNLNEEMLERLQQPIYLDGILLKKFEILNINKNKLTIKIFEGKYHQIKRIFKIVNNRVVKLNRVSVGELHLNKLSINIGEYKEIRPNEVLKDFE